MNYRRVIALLVLLFAGCGFMGSEKEEEWLSQNLDRISEVKSEILSMSELTVVYVQSDIVDGSFFHKPTSEEVEAYNGIRAKLHSLGISRAEVDLRSGGVGFVTYDSGVFGDIYQSFDFIPAPSKSVKLTTPEVWSCKKLDVELWYVCEGVAASDTPNKASH
ncbi:hypothetical protein [Corallincola holothuriorum]|nr:hypothetical protein [Corallincola holothuriorum]